MYGKNKSSTKKIEAAKIGKSHVTIKSIAEILRVEIPTAEVYIIDAYCAGAPMIAIEKLGRELNIESPNVERIAVKITEGLSSLRQIKDALNNEVSYNQIKVVLAGMIRDELGKIIERFRFGLQYHLNLSFSHSDVPDVCD